MLRCINRFIFMFWCTRLYTKYWFLAFLIYRYITYINIDYGILLLVNPEKYILRLGLHSLKRLNRAIIERRRADISIANIPISEMFFQQQIISSRDMIMFISFNTSSRILQIKFKLGQFIQYCMVNRHPMISHHYPRIQWNIINLFAPRMRINLFQVISFTRIHIQYFL
jgi:hypothetical protein